MKKLRNVIRSSYFKGFLPYLLSSLVPLVTLVIFGIVTTSIVHNQNSVIIEDKRSQIVIRLNDIFSEIKSYDSKLYDSISNTTFSDTLTATQYWSEPRYAALRDTFTQISLDSRYVSDCFVYMPNVNYVISAHGIQSQAAFTASLASGFDPFAIDNFSEPMQNLADSDYVSCKTTYKIAAGDITICYLVKKSDFSPETAPNSYTSGANVYLFNLHNRLVLSNTNNDARITSPRDVERLPGHVVYHDSVSFANSIYHVSIAIPFGFLTFFPTLLWIIMLIILMLNVAFSIIMLRKLANNNYKPMINISRLLSENQLAYEYGIIEESIRTLIDTNTQLKSDISAHQHTISEFLLTQLLQSSFSDELAFILDKYGIAFLHESFVVLSFDISVPDHSSNEPGLRAALIANVCAMLDQLDDTVHYHTTDNARIVFIVNTALKDTVCLAQLSKAIAKALRLTKDKMYFQAKVGLSRVYTEYLGISQAFIESLQAMYISEVNPNDSEIYLYDDFKEQADELNTDLDHKLLESVMNDDVYETQQILDTMIAMLKYTARKQRYEFLYRLSNTLFKIPYLLKLSAEDTEAFQATIPLPSADINLDEFRQTLAEALKEVMNKTIKYRVNNSDNIIKIAMEYTQKNYADCNLSLNDICSHLGYTQNYFSTLFKQNQGISWLNYLHTLRIEKAKQLILDGIPVNECFQQVGYTNLRSFNRTFKKITGMNVSEYRANH